MVRAGINQTNFSQGVYSEDYSGNIDSETVLNGLAEGENIIILPEGGFVRRPGTRERANFVTSSNIIKFDSNTRMIFEPTGNLRIFIEGQPQQDILGTGISGTNVHSIKTVKIRDSLIIVNRFFAPKILTRDSGGTWSLTDWDYKDGPWETENFDNTLKIRPTAGFTLGDNGYTGTNTIVAVNKKDNLDTWFDDNWVTQGRKIRLYSVGDTNFPNEVGYATLTLNSVTVSNQEFNVTVDDEYPLLDEGPGSHNKAWSLSAWYNDNFPENIAIFQNRIYFFRDDWVWATVAGDLNTFSPNLPVIDNSSWVTSSITGLSIEAANAEDSNLQWAVEYQGLQLGYDNKISLLDGGSLTASVTNSNISIIKQNGQECSDIEPVVGRFLYFVNETRDRIYRLRYEFILSSFLAEEVTTNNRKLFRQGIRDIEMFSSPFKMLWVVLEDGSIAIGTVQDEEKLEIAWTRIVLANNTKVRYIINRNEIPEVLTATGLLLAFGDIIVAKGEQKTTYQYSGTLPYSYLVSSDYREYVGDLGLSVSAGSVNTDGLSADTRYVDLTTYENFTPGQGTKTLDNDGEVSYDFFASVTFRPVDLVQSQTSESISKKNIQRVFLNIVDTGEFEIKEKDVDTWKIAQFLPQSDLTVIGSLATGIHEEVINSSGKENLQIQLRQTKALPLQVNSITYDVDIDQLK